jgi:uncharacterized damage-inducible protein DinB
MTPAEAILHLRYSGWASRRLMDAARALPSDDLHRPLGVSHQSILGTLGHVYWADWIWCSRVVDPNVPRLAEVTFEVLEEDWRVIQGKWEQWAEGIDAEGLARKIVYHGRDGNACQNEVWKLVLHVVNHATLHRGQVMGMLRQVGVKPPATDLLYYYRENQ